MERILDLHASASSEKQESTGFSRGECQEGIFMANNGSNGGGGAGVGFFGLLGILFIGLKLTGLIDWDWWLVLLPIYGPLALILAILAVLLLAKAVTDGTRVRR